MPTYEPSSHTEKSIQMVAPAASIRPAPSGPGGPRKRALARRAEAEAVRQVRHLEQAAHRAAGAHDAQLLARRLDLAAGLEQRAERGRVDELDAGEIQHDERAGRAGRDQEHR